jgi:hypothetical protein
MKKSLFVLVLILLGTMLQATTLDEELRTSIQIARYGA